MVALIVKHRVGALSARLDLANVFKHILIRSQDWPLLGSSWDLQHPESSTCCVYYVDLFLFNKYADAPHYAIKTNKVHDLLHYLDDYFTIGPPQPPVCTNNIATMIAKCEELGFTVNSEKLQNQPQP